MDGCKKRTTRQQSKEVLDISTGLGTLDLGEVMWSSHYDVWKGISVDMHQELTARAQVLFVMTILSKLKGGGRWSVGGEGMLLCSMWAASSVEND